MRYYNIDREETFDNFPKLESLFTRKTRGVSLLTTLAKKGKKVN